MAGPRISVSSDEGFALALSETGNVYSWGKGHKGRLGHQGSDNLRRPTSIEGLLAVDVVMVHNLLHHSRKFCISFLGL